LYISKEATHNYILENKELYLQIKDAIKSITAPACRRAFELQYIELKSHKEISSDMKIKPQVVNNQVSRALKVVRARLQKVV
jgi:RNA polymerase sigma-70 factor (ECF subfamily)